MTEKRSEGRGKRKRKKRTVKVREQVRAPEFSNTYTSVNRELVLNYKEDPNSW